MTRIIKPFISAMIVACLFLLAGCSSNGNVDFVKKYKVDFTADQDMTSTLQQAIDELPENGVLYLSDGVYPLESNIVFKDNMTLQLSENAVLLNRSPEKNPTMAFNHPLNHNKAEGCSNIVIEGGVWDLNGQLNEDGTPQNLPQLESINALGFGYASNVTVKNVTFRDCFNGHVMQLAGMDQVLVENCRFEGQWFLGAGNKTREMVQIEPGTIKGYPYTLLQNNAPSTNITIRNCYFGGSENTSKYLIAIGTHSQQAGDKCSDIVIEGCTFDNASYANIHFMAYDRITIRDNTFNMNTDSQEPERYCILADTYGSFIDPTGAASTTELTIEGNTFNVDAPNTTGISITTNNRSPKRITGVYLKGNTLTSSVSNTGIYLYLVENCVIDGNSFNGFDPQIAVKDCDNQIQSDVEITTMND